MTSKSFGWLLVLLAVAAVSFIVIVWSTTSF